MPENNENTARRVRMLASIAHYLFTQGRALFIAGMGEDVDGVDIQNVLPEIDTIPSETDGARWADAAARFIRYVVQILQVSLQEEYDERNGNLLDISNTLGVIFEDNENTDTPTE